MPFLNRSKQLDRNRKSMAAIRKYLATLPSIRIAGVAYTPDEILAVFQKDTDLADAATQARANLLAAAQAARAHDALMRTAILGFRSFLLNEFSDASIVAEFGFTPRKQGNPNVETKAAAALKAKATRAARHTMGKNQKKAITGNVTGIVVTPTTTPTTTAAGGAPLAVERIGG